jgi:hypothetical protein
LVSFVGEEVFVDLLDDDGLGLLDTAVVGDHELSEATGPA